MIIPNFAFWQSTRGKLIALLRRAEHTVAELAQRLGLTDNAVRAHLITLERDGLVRISGQRPGTRRPNYVYQLAQGAEQLFPKAYAPVLDQVLSVLQDRLPPEAQQKALAEVGHRLARPHADELANLPLGKRIERVVELLAAMGGDAQIIEDADTIRIQGNGCPLSKLTRDPDHPAGCSIMQAMLGMLLGVPVTEACQRGESPRCCFVVARPPAGIGEHQPE